MPTDAMRLRVQPRVAGYATGARTVAATRNQVRVSRIAARLRLAANGDESRRGCHLLRGQYCPRSNSRVTIVCLNREIDNSRQPRSSLLFRTSSSSDSARGVRCPIGANWIRSAEITRGSLDATQLAATLMLEGPSCGLPQTRTPTSVGAWYRVAEGLSAAPHRLSSDR